MMSASSPLNWRTNAIWEILLYTANADKAVFDYVDEHGLGAVAIDLYIVLTDDKVEYLYKLAMENPSVAATLLKLCKFDKFSIARTITQLNPKLPPI